MYFLYCYQAVKFKVGFSLQKCVTQSTVWYGSDNADGAASYFFRVLAPDEK